MKYTIEVTKEKVILTLPGGAFTEIKNTTEYENYIFDMLTEMKGRAFIMAKQLREKEAA